MVKVRPESERSANYKGAAAEAQRRWVPAVNRAEWQAPSLAGQDLYATQMSKPDVQARRGISIAKVADTEWRATTVKKGGTILATRMSDATDKQVAGFRPFASALEGVTLEPKTDDPDANVDNRVKPIVRAMVNTKKQVKGY
jgi:hypothetical protein